MVITVTCPSCSSSFPVDSDKVPEKGVNARCSTCGDIFRVEKPTESAAPSAPAVAPEPEPLPPPAVPEPEEPRPPAADPVPVGSAGLEDVQVVPPPSVAEPPAPPPPEPQEAAPAAEGGGFRFGKRDPTDKAKRLARVLVSDMIMYNAERHANALEAGTLKEDFEEEIDKSWKEFVEQVGSDIAEGPGQEFWTEALNDILAKGERIF